MKKMYILLMGLAAIFLLNAVSCTPTKTENLEPEITNSGSVTENVDQSYWTKKGMRGSATAYLTFYVFADDPDGIEDITYVSVTSPIGSEWTLRDKDEGKDEYNVDNKVFRGFFKYDSDYPNIIYLGEYKVLVRDSDGNEVTDKFSINKPGSKSGSGFIFSENYYGSTRKGTEMLKRATDIYVSKNLDRIKVQFSVDDSRAYDGYISFYDISGKYIESTRLFRKKINDKGGLNKDGTNTIQIKPSDLKLYDFSYNDIKGLHVVLTDGAQFSSDNTSYNHISISEYKKIK